VFTFGAHNFQNMMRKEAVEKIRSCDLTSITMEIGRASRSGKPTIMVRGRGDSGTKS